MPLKDIIQVVAADIGAPNYNEDAGVRNLLLSRINKAAREVYERTDLTGCLREIFVRVTPDMVIALPQFVGELRAIRQASLGRPWTLNDLRPRYHAIAWKTYWRGWRLIGYGAVQITITNSAPVTITIPVADPTQTVTVVGSTIESNRAIDTITLSSTSNTGTINFTNIDSIQLNQVSNYDIVVDDADGNNLATIFNNTLESRYMLFDVSTYPSGGSCVDGSVLMEVLYKMRLTELVNDNDIFPVPDYDDVIAEKAIQLFVERQEGKEDRAIMMDQKIERSITRKEQDKSGTMIKKIKFEENPLLGVTRGRRGYSSRRFGMRGW